MNKKILFFFLIFLNSFFMLGNAKEEKPFTILSTAFNNNGFIPKKYTCDSNDISPLITWENLPENTKSLALIVDDPDAPSMTWVHWVIYNIPISEVELEEDIPKNKIYKNGITQGLNDFGEVGYGGPCPPKGIHNYHFKLYALKENLNLNPELTKDLLLKKIKSYIISEVEIVGKYERNKI